MKNIVIISASPRKNGNSEVLVDNFSKGAIANGNKAEIIRVRDVNPKFCLGCLYCQTHDCCVINDGMNELYEMVQHADVLVFATPVYYYSVSGQLKTFLDRLNPLFPRTNKFKEVYLLATAADGDESAMDGAKTAVQGWVDCFDGVKFVATLCGVGVNDIGDIKTTVFPSQAYELGANV